MGLAHLLRDLTFVAEQEQQTGADELKALLRGMQQAAAEWRSCGAVRLPRPERDEWVAQYHALLAHGFAAQPPPESAAPHRRGRRKQSAAQHLLDDLLRRAEQVLGVLDTLSLPTTNNQAERDLRMSKVQQKISGTFRSETGATAFCRLRSSLGTMRKQGHSMLDALVAAIQGTPLPVAWGT